MSRRWTSSTPLCSTLCICPTTVREWGKRRKVCRSGKFQTWPVRDMTKPSWLNWAVSHTSWLQYILSWIFVLNVCFLPFTSYASHLWVTSEISFAYFCFFFLIDFTVLVTFENVLLLFRALRLWAKKDCKMKS